MKLLRQLSSGVLLVGLGAGIASAIFLWQPWDSGESSLAESVATSTPATPNPTRDQPSLSKEEAIGLVVAAYQGCRFSTESVGDVGSYISRRAEAKYEGNGKWRVTIGDRHEWTVNGTTGSVIPIGDPLPCN